MSEGGGTCMVCGRTHAQAVQQQQQQQRPDTTVACTAEQVLTVGLCIKVLGRHGRRHA